MTVKIVTVMLHFKVKCNPIPQSFIYLESRLLHIPIYGTSVACTTISRGRGPGVVLIARIGRSEAIGGGGGGGGELV